MSEGNRSLRSKGKAVYLGDLKRVPTGSYLHLEPARQHYGKRPRLAPHDKRRFALLKRTGRAVTTNIGQDTGGHFIKGTAADRPARQVHIGYNPLNRQRHVDVPSRANIAPDAGFPLSELLNTSSVCLEVTSSRSATLSERTHRGNACRGLTG